MKPVSLAATLACGLGLLGGCGSSRTVTIETTTTSRTATSVPSQSSGPARTPAGAPIATAPPVHLATFRSPSGNLGCQLIGGSARCDIRRRSWSPPPRPASCPSQVDFGQGLEISSGQSRIVCAGDTALNASAPPLPYGRDTDSVGFSCSSRTTGITCTSSTTRHGFFISAQSYRLF
ncbi:MAG: hypothetical protein M3Z27_10635 [Actinomycetota bacterium]|nr:hypothetical protein [Actinomycetota bacterium]